VLDEQLLTATRRVLNEDDAPAAGRLGEIDGGLDDHQLRRLKPPMEMGCR